MNKKLWTLCLILLSFSVQAQQVCDTVYLERLQAMADADQNARRLLDSTLNRDSVWRVIHEVDAANLIGLKQLIADRGFPTLSKVGYKCCHLASLIAQHQPAEFLHWYLEQAQAAADTGDFDLTWIAYMTDRDLNHCCPKNNNPASTQSFFLYFCSRKGGNTTTFFGGKYKYMENKKLQAALERWQEIQPLSEDDRNRLSRRFTVDFNYNSNHIEGNTLTYGQTELLLLFGKVIGEANVKDVQDMAASNVTLHMMQEEALIKETPLTQSFIRTLHRTLLREDYTVYRNLPGGVQTSYIVHAGQYKTRPNSVITRYGDRFEYASPEETPALMTDLVDWYNKAEAEGKLPPVELAVLFHYRYIRIHPFEDGNGRIARLMFNYILSRHGYPMIVVRSRSKHLYLEALHQADLIMGAAPHDGAHASLKDIRPFHKYMANLIAHEIENDVLFIVEKNENVWWYDGERIVFRSENYSKILREIQLEKNATYSYLQEAIGINRSAIQKMLLTMREKSYIDRAVDGSWRVFITPSVV